MTRPLELTNTIRSLKSILGSGTLAYCTREIL